MTSRSCERGAPATRRRGSSLFARHYRSVHAFFARALPEAADDLTQRTLLACVEALDAFRGEASFRGFLFGIARNQLLKQLRSRARAQAALERNAEDDYARTSPSAMVGRRQEQHLLLLAFAALPGDLQLTIELFYWQDLRTSEIAAAMAVPISTVTTPPRAGARAAAAVRRASSADPSIRASLCSRDLDGWTRSLADAHADGP